MCGLNTLSLESVRKVHQLRRSFLSMRTAMARRLSSIKSVTVFPGSNWPGRTMATTRGKSKPPLPKFRCCASKSSSAATTRKALSSCRAAGSSSELSLGLAAIAASPRITKISPGPSLAAFAQSRIPRCRIRRNDPSIWRERNLDRYSLTLRSLSLAKTESTSMPASGSAFSTPEVPKTPASLTGSLWVSRVVTSLDTRV